MYSSFIRSPSTQPMIFYNPLTTTTAKCQIIIFGGNPLNFIFSDSTQCTLITFPQYTQAKVPVSIGSSSTNKLFSIKNHFIRNLYVDGRDI